MTSKNEVMLRIYLDNFPLVHMHYSSGCKDPDYLTSAVETKFLILPDDWHVTKTGNVVKHNPNAHIKIIPQTFSGNIYNAVLRLNPGKIVEGYLKTELITQSCFLDELVLPNGWKLNSTKELICSDSSSNTVPINVIKDDLTTFGL